jgi:hypothetical protein
LRRIEKLREEMEVEGKNEEVGKINELWKRCHGIVTYAVPFISGSCVGACRQSADRLFQLLDLLKHEVEAWEAKDGLSDIWNVYSGFVWTQKLDEVVHFYCKGFKQGFGLFSALDKLEDQIVGLRQHTGEHQTMPEEEEKLSNLQLHREQMCNLLFRKE